MGAVSEGWWSEVERFERQTEVQQQDSDILFRLVGTGRVRGIPNASYVSDLY